MFCQVLTVMMQIWIFVYLWNKQCLNLESWQLCNVYVSDLTINLESRLSAFRFISLSTGIFPWFDFTVSQNGILICFLGNIHIVSYFFNKDHFRCSQVNIGCIYPSLFLSDYSTQNPTTNQYPGVWQPWLQGLLPIKQAGMINETRHQRCTDPIQHRRSVNIWVSTFMPLGIHTIPMDFYSIHQNRLSWMISTNQYQFYTIIPRNLLRIIIHEK